MNEPSRPDAGLLARLERYYDAVPRRRARVEDVGPFTLFVAQSGWPYYARPRLGETGHATNDDVRRLVQHQQELEVPQTLEWVDENTPGLVDIASEAGMAVELCPLMVLDGEPRGPIGTARMLAAEEGEQIRLSQAAVSVSFAHAGTDTGDPGIVERDALATTRFASVSVDLGARIAAGEFAVAAVYPASAPQLGPVGGGGYSPLDGIAEITGVGVLPAFRRQGFGAQLSRVLSEDALSHGVRTVFCSAQSEAVARVYAGVGFRRVGTACIANGTSAR
ncbi:MAG: GNAT family N-acetyltransferase [Nocardioidaceae bacterium]